MIIHFSETVVYTQHLEEEIDVSSYLFIHLFFFFSTKCNQHTGAIIRLVAVKLRENFTGKENYILFLFSGKEDQSKS